MDDWGFEFFEHLLSPSGAFQAVLVAAGIYFFLSFLKTSRGSGLVRGLVVAIAVIGLSLLWAAKKFEMGELEHILTENYGSFVLILVILFQPELRRGVSRLGEQNKLARLLRGERPEAVTEVAAAMIAMAKRRHGALIAFQRNTALDAWTQNAVRIQSHVDRRLLQGIFQPGGTLHDGAVIIDQDRLVAASCIFPLTENTELHSTIGTRHRAALGLSEETDALTVAVSEETGEISVCESGTMQRDVDHERLEGLLRNRLGADDASQAVDERRNSGVLASSLGFLRAVFLENLGRKVAALLLAGAWLYQAHENIREEIYLTLTVTDEVLSVEGNPTPNTIFVQMLPDDTHLSPSVSDAEFKVKIFGPKGEIRLIESKELSGTWSRDEDFKTGDPLEIDDVHFVCGDKPLDDRVTIMWEKGNQPHIDLEHTDEISIVLSPDHVPVSDKKLDPHFEFNSDGTGFSLPKVVVRGPAAQIELLKNNELDIRVESLSDDVALFKLVALIAEDRTPRFQSLVLSKHLEERNLQLSDETQVVAALLHIVPTSWDLGSIELELPMVDLSSATGTQPTRWKLASALKAEFGVRAEAVIPTTESPDTQSFKERRASVRRFVKENLIVFVDISQLDPDGPDDSTTAKVRWFWPPPDWRVLLEEEIGPMAPEARVEVLLKSPIDGEVLLMKFGATNEPSLGTVDGGEGPN